MMKNVELKSAVVTGGTEQTSHISELLLPETGRRLGFRIGGHSAGPNVLVACQSKLGRQVYQRLLLIPSLNRLKGRLFLISLDRLDDLKSLGSLRGFLGVEEPIDNILTLPAPDMDALTEQAAAEMVRRNYWAILRLCARVGMVQGRGIPERDGRLA